MAGKISWRVIYPMGNSARWRSPGPSPLTILTDFQSWKGWDAEAAGFGDNLWGGGHQTELEALTPDLPYKENQVQAIVDWLLARWQDDQYPAGLNPLQPVADGREIIFRFQSDNLLNHCNAGRAVRSGRGLDVNPLL